MSRCFPYPQPGYVRKPRDLTVIFTQEKVRGDKEKKKKKKKRKREKDEKVDRSSADKTTKKDGVGTKMEYADKQRLDDSRELAADCLQAGQQPQRQVVDGTFDGCNGTHQKKATTPYSNAQEQLPRVDMTEYVENPNVSLRSDSPFQDKCYAGQRYATVENDEDTFDTKAGSFSREPPYPPVADPNNGSEEGFDGGCEGEDDKWLTRKGVRSRTTERISVSVPVEFSHTSATYVKEFDVCILPYIVPF